MTAPIGEEKWVGRQHRGSRSRKVLLVNGEPRESGYYANILRRAGCRVRATASFTEGVRLVKREPFDLILLDQGEDGFQGRNVLAEAMEIDPERRVLVLARSYDESCYLEALQSGALEYLEGHLSAAEIMALLETFLPARHPPYSPRDSGRRSEAARYSLTHHQSMHLPLGSKPPLRVYEWRGI